MGTGVTKKLSGYSGRERETQKSLPAVRERELKAFHLGNIREQEFPLMPADPGHAGKNCGGGNLASLASVLFIT